MVMGYECIHVPEDTYEWIETDLDGRETVRITGLCALCGRYYELRKEETPA